MTCEEYTSLASGTLEGQRIGFFDHLRMFYHGIICVYCRLFFKQIKRIRYLLRREPVAETMPAELREKIRRHISGKA